jgi:hypothetical protein
MRSKPRLLALGFAFGALLQLTACVHERASLLDPTDCQRQLPPAVRKFFYLPSSDSIGVARLQNDLVGKWAGQDSASLPIPSDVQNRVATEPGKDSVSVSVSNRPASTIYTFRCQQSEDGDEYFLVSFKFDGGRIVDIGIDLYFGRPSQPSGLNN